MNYTDIPEDHAGMLRTLLGLGEAADLPPLCVTGYWQFKRCMDRAGCGITERELAILAFLEGRGAPLPGEGEPDIVALYRNGTIPWGAEVEVLFQKLWRTAKVVGIDGNLDVLVDMNGEERKFNRAKVRLPEMAGV